MVGSMRMIVPDWPSPLAHVGALSTTRVGGFSNAPFDAGYCNNADQFAGGLNLAQHVGDDAETVIRNRTVLRSHLPTEPTWLNQVHGTVVHHARPGLNSQDIEPPTADASIATESGVVCAVMTADCLPVLLCDPRQPHIGAAHAGWRGLAGGVLQRSVSAMRAAGADNIWAWLGPAIGPDHFEVGEEVRTVFCQQQPAAASAFVAIAGRPGKYLADLYVLARLALRSVGVTQISGGDQCTVCQRDTYFSFRRDQRCGRMASMIWLR